MAVLLTSPEIKEESCYGTVCCHAGCFASLPWVRCVGALHFCYLATGYGCGARRDVSLYRHLALCANERGSDQDGAAWFALSSPDRSCDRSFRDSWCHWPAASGYQNSCGLLSGRFTHRSVSGQCACGSQAHSSAGEESHAALDAPADAVNLDCASAVDGVDNPLSSAELSNLNPCC